MAKKKPSRITIKTYTRKVCGTSQKVKAHNRKKAKKPSKQKRLL